MPQTFIQRIVREQNKAEVREEPRLEQQRQPAKKWRALYIQSRGQWWRNAKRGVGKTLRGSSRLIYFAPLWIVAQLLCRAIGLQSTFAIVGFVITVCIFFAVLNVYIWIAAIEWILAREERAVFPIAPDGSDALGILPRGAPTIGTIAKLEPADEAGRGYSGCLGA